MRSTNLRRKQTLSRGARRSGRLEGWPRRERTSARDNRDRLSLGNDVVDMRQLFGSIGYTGTDPLADKWLSLTTDASGTGTDFVIDPHNMLKKVA